MSSQKRIASSRANGAKSRGPVTPEGRARSNMGPVTHGLTSRCVLLRNESEEEFLALRDVLVAHFQPSDPYEADLVEQLVAARWRLDRVSSLETALLEVEISRREPEIEKEFQSCSPDIRNALAFRALFDESRVLAGLSRYESRFRRACDKLTKKLDSLRAIRELHKEPSQPPTDPRPSGGTPLPSSCPPSPSEPAAPDVAQALKPAASALQPTPKLPQPPTPPREAQRPRCLSTSHKPRATSGRRRRPLLESNQGMLSR
jgi:hypothetical protein